jgi:hypothetical protein
MRQVAKVAGLPAYDGNFLFATSYARHETCASLIGQETSPLTKTQGYKITFPWAPSNDGPALGKAPRMVVPMWIRACSTSSVS